MDITQIKADILNYNDKLFFNSAGSSLPVKSVVTRITDYLVEEQQIGGYAVEGLQINSINNFYKQAAHLLNCKSENIAFVHNSTDGFSKALLSIDFNKGDVIITSDEDYVSNQFQFIALKKRFGIKIVRIEALENGDLDISNFEKLVEQNNPKLVAITHVPTNSGLIQDVKSIGDVCYQKDILFLLDACQSVGQLKVDVKDIKCDFLVVTGRKWLRAPRGTGILFVSDKVLERNMFPLVIDNNGALWTEANDFKLSKTAKRFELYESSRALMVGFGEALEYLNALGIENIEQRNKELTTSLRANLKVLTGVNLYDKGSNKSNIVTFRKENGSLQEIQNVLNKNQVFHSVSTKSSGFIDFDKKGVDWVIRLSPHYFNTKEEIDTVSEIIESI